MANERLEISGCAKASYIKPSYSVSALRGSFGWFGSEIVGFSGGTVIDDEALVQMKISWANYIKVRTPRGELCCVQTPGSGQREAIFVKLTHGQNVSP